MSGLFEHMAATEDFSRTAGRKAVALARARVDKRFARFIFAGANVPEQSERLALVAGELEQTVKEACAEVDHHDWEGVRDAVLAHMGWKIDGSLFTEEDGIRLEARRPKMCPFHREVTDISLAAGDPTAGFASMAQHTYGPMSCRGGEYEGGCNFKPEMVTQTFWDQKAEKAEQRRQERQLQQQQQQVDTTLDISSEPDAVENANEAEMSQNDMPTAPEPTAVGTGPEPAQMSMAARTAAGATLPDHTGPIERQDVQKGSEGTPSPKMDKRKWTPENVDFLDDVDSKQGPHPSEHIDIAEPAAYGGDWEKVQQIDGPTVEKQDVTQSSGFSSDKAHGQWPSGGDRSAVSSRVGFQFEFDEPPSPSQAPSNSGSMCVGCGKTDEHLHPQTGQCYDCDQGVNYRGGPEQVPGVHAAVSEVPQAGAVPGHPQGCTCPECIRANLGGGNNIGPAGAQALQQRIQQGPPANAAYATVDPDQNPIRESIIDFPSDEEADRAIQEFNNG